MAEKTRRVATRAVKVLVIEDEDDLCEVIEKRLKTAGSFHVATALDGERGLRAAAEFRPDVVLLDLAMPGLNGWEVCRALRSDPATAGVAIVLMTARWESNADPLAEALRVERVLFKPLDFGTLVDTLRDAA